MSLFNNRVFVATNRTIDKRDLIFEDKKLSGLMEAAISKRQRSLEQADDLWNSAESKFRSFGIDVHFAPTAEDARSYIANRIPTGSLVVKGKSLTTEEIELRQFLETKGAEVVETDLGEWIIQERGELPSHLIIPAIHLDASQVAKMIKQRFEVVLDKDPETITKFIRTHLREKFLSADVGIVGSNFVTADPPNICIVSNEGNVSLASRLPKTVFVVVGYDRIYDTTTGLSNVQKLLTASATGQENTSYLDFIRKPLPHQTIHLVVLDNGRKNLLDSELKEAARCVRCASCLNSCPVYQEVGGHVFGNVYHGGIGSLLTKFTSGSKAASKIASLCMRCSTCESTCPMQIPISKLVSIASADLKIPFLQKGILKSLSAHKPVKQGGRSAIFIGCAFRSPLLKKDTRAILSFAERFVGDGVVIDNGCCGMPHFNKGLTQESNERLSRLNETLSKFDVVHVPCASCYSFLHQSLGNKIQLLTDTLPDNTSKPRTETDIYYHTPCHMKQLEDQTEKDTLSKIIDFATWDEDQRCCGAGGTYFLEHPRISKKILSRKTTIDDKDPTIVTSCPSCLLQLRRKYPRSRVIHPARLMIGS